MPPNEYGTREGWTSASLNFFGEGAFYEEAYRPERGYFSQGIESPQTWVFRQLFLDAFLLARILAEQPHVQPGRIGAMGMSQGAGMSIWMGSFCPLIRAVAADMPFLGDMERVMEGKALRYPLKEVFDFIGNDETRRSAVMRTLSYFDTVTVASECRVPTLVSAGLKDPAVRPFQVDAIYSALPGEKSRVDLDWGHDWHPTMVDRNLEWLESHLPTS